MSVYDFSLEKADGTKVSLGEYKGKVLLIVNTATKCGFTPQYDALQALYDKYKDKGFEIIDIPCNQFKEQAPGTDEEIQSFCSMNFNIKFQQFKKSDVNGENELALYTYLKGEQPFKGFTGSKSLMMKGLLKIIDPDYKNNPAIKWNFTKFLIDKEGMPVRRFEPTESMEDVDKAVGDLL